MDTYLGIEFGSTRIKAVAIGDSFAPTASGDYTWKSAFENGVWTYDLAEVWTGLKAALKGVNGAGEVKALGISAMMHGYLAFDKDWNLLVPFRTWQNTITGPAAAELTALFGFNIPQRWSIAHLYQAILNGEPHLDKLAHITTLAGYVHYKLSGRNVLGVGDASGMFPIDSDKLDYDQRMLDLLDQKLAGRFPWKVRDVLPQVLPAGADAGAVTPAGSALVDGLLPAGVPMAPAEGDAGTGMTATNAVAARTGNVSAGTSIFAMVVLERPLSKVYPELDMVTTPDGKPVAMVHCNNCTNDMNAWVSLLGETLALFGVSANPGELYTKLYQKSLEGAADCDGITVYNYLAGEPVTGLNEAGRPLVVRKPETAFTLASFLRAQLYATMASLAAGMDLLHQEKVAVDRLMGHGGLFKTPVVGQRYMAAATGSPVWVMETAGEGGAYGIALLAAYLRLGQGQTLDAFLEKTVFAGAPGTVQQPLEEDAKGFRAYLDRFLAGLDVQKAAVASL
ncbi:MAG: ATPase [Oscillospiraceae bacterium]|nr:ATPase [Oscillospiraceae bacterium]